ncbi:MAG: glucose-1-phosphate thymidylyltransferase RfbA [Alphaproteobacteria bacterium]|nr:glucose-1-phosphate thymidylyltransferase RfbA [Alphaproteobacteria bacterium]
MINKPTTITNPVIASQRRGIILAGGTGTRLYPMTRVVSKQLLPIYDKPMIYYPLSVLMLAGMKEILIISTPDDTPRLQKLLGDGTDWGMSFSYVVQLQPRGLADALILADDFLAGNPSALILGDNIFYGHDLADILVRADQRQSGAMVFAYHVGDPRRYGVVEFDAGGRAVRIVEKPKTPASSYAVTGLYFYDHTAPKRARHLTPSARGELEITDLNNSYLTDGALAVEILHRGHAWLDTGTAESLLAAGQFVATLENRQGLKICCPEEIAWRLGYIDSARLKQLAQPLLQNSYGQYLLHLAEGASR